MLLRFFQLSSRRLSIGPTKTTAVKLIVRNAHVCSKLMTRTMTKTAACNASGNKSEKQYGNQFFHFPPRSTAMDVSTFPSLDQAELCGLKL
jgi:hypothetical protein